MGRLRIQSKYRLGYFGIVQSELERIKNNLKEVIDGMSDQTDPEKTVRSHSSECLKEIQEVSYLVANLRTDGPAKSILMVTQAGEIMDIISGKIIDQNEAFNQLIDNIKQ